MKFNTWKEVFSCGKLDLGGVLLMVNEELNTGVGVNVEGFLFALLLILDIGRL